jgi:hypothetical protein
MHGWWFKNLMVQTGKATIPFLFVYLQLQIKGILFSFYTVKKRYAGSVNTLVLADG